MKMAYYLRNLHAQFFDDDHGVKKIKVYFETHMDNVWSLIDVQVPPPATSISDNLILVFKIDEKPSKNQFVTSQHTYVYDIDIPAGFKHFTTVILYHSLESDHDSVGTAGDPN
jgi:hypothetical protein